jgi:formylmethanofuran dehydrogenase subunit A
MKVKELIEKLKEYPEDMEVVMEEDGKSYYYNMEFDFEVITSLLDSVPDDKFRQYYKEDYDGYWSFQYTPTKVLLIY